MAIKVSQAFERTSAAPIDSSIALTKAQMLAVNDNLMPAYYFTICQDDGKIYLYDKTATPSATTGKFTEFSGGSGTGGSEVFLTTATLDTDINDTTTVLAADLSGVDFDDITIGVTLIRDDKGTMGLVTAKNGTTDITVTTATTSTPTKELTQAEYDALTEAEKKNGTIYFITDNYVGSTYVGALETIYSTTEKVIGSYMGKPLYQKTVEFTNTATYQNEMLVSIGNLNIENCIKISGTITADNGLVMPVNSYANSSAYAACWLDNTKTNLEFFNFYDNRLVNRPAQVTIQYTKTTDTTSPVEYASPNDYSTSEKIVGTWIDGKPLYQKTYTVARAANVGNTPITHELSFDYITVTDAVIIADDKSVIFPLPNNWVDANGSNSLEQSEVFINPTTINIRIRNGEVTVPGTIYITVKYTKTTD